MRASSAIPGSDGSAKPRSSALISPRFRTVNCSTDGRVRSRSSAESDGGEIETTGLGTCVTKLTCSTKVYVSSITVGVTVHVYETTANGRKKVSLWNSPVTSTTRLAPECRSACAEMAYDPSGTAPKAATPEKLARTVVLARVSSFRMVTGEPVQLVRSAPRKVRSSCSCTISSVTRSVTSTSRTPICAKSAGPARAIDAVYTPKPSEALGRATTVTTTLCCGPRSTDSVGATTESTGSSGGSCSSSGPVGPSPTLVAVSSKYVCAPSSASPRRLPGAHTTCARGGGGSSTRMSTAATVDTATPACSAVTVTESPTAVALGAVKRTVTVADPPGAIAADGCATANEPSVAVLPDSFRATADRLVTGTGLRLVTRKVVERMAGPLRKRTDRVRGDGASPSARKCVCTGTAPLSFGCFAVTV
mmetsp:Transcript_21935/g.65607  ORF Transcript_21935/g.65607 Transcript_21935/m.65607 type:complete len:420 (+) Transcript_21935:273-1532(+)